MNDWKTTRFKSRTSIILFAQLTNMDYSSMDWMDCERNHNLYSSFHYLIWIIKHFCYILHRIKLLHVWLVVVVLGVQMERSNNCLSSWHKNKNYTQLSVVKIKHKIRQVSEKSVYKMMPVVGVLLDRSRHRVR